MKPKPKHLVSYFCPRCRGAKTGLAPFCHRCLLDDLAKEQKRSADLLAALKDEQAKTAKLLDALVTVKHTLAYGRNVGADWVAAALDAEEIARAAIAEAKEG